MNRIVISDESVNSYGFRLLSKGVRLDAFTRNPVMLYNHDYSILLGILKDIRLEDGGKITAEPEFDMDDEFAAKLARKYEKKHLSAASVGFQPISWSEDNALMIEGQDGPTVTEWELYEVSLVTLPSNTNAVQLFAGDGQPISWQKDVSLSLQFEQSSMDNTKFSLKDTVASVLAELGWKKPESKDDQEAADTPTELKLEDVVNAVNTELSAQITTLQTQLSDKSTEIITLKATHATELSAKDTLIAEQAAEITELSNGLADDEETPQPSGDNAGNTSGFKVDLGIWPGLADVHKKLATK